MSSIQDFEETKRVNRRAFWLFFVLFAILGGLGYYAWRVNPVNFRAIHITIKNPFAKKPVPVGYYRVVEAVDGDTIVVEMNGSQERIRMIGVDTPETHHPEKPVQCFGLAAAKFTKDLVDGKVVRLENDQQSNNRDRYDRLLRYVFTEDGTLLNRKLIEDGYGFAYVSFPFDKQQEFLTAEREARQNNRGLWSGCEVNENDLSPSTTFRN